MICRYEFDHAGGKFQRYDIRTNGPAGIGLDRKALGLDGDGDLDRVLPGRSGLCWHENLPHPSR
ncbi:MAG: hypothetical protein HY736_13415 [Verrucomicrobia bacterium]|nr:hypothetical protein [Verrucomicrobiota bacterium]